MFLGRPVRNQPSLYLVKIQFPIGLLFYNVFFCYYIWSHVALKGGKNLKNYHLRMLAIILMNLYCKIGTKTKPHTLHKVHMHKNASTSAI